MHYANIEKFLQDTIFTDLERGRPHFDKPHTIAVVQKLKEIITNTPEIDVDELVLIIAAFGHDWGYTGLFEDGEPIATYEKIKEAKAEHMIMGAQKMKMLLKNDVFNTLSENQKNRIVHLIANHDKLNELRNTDELILMEADTLGMLDSSLVKPTFNKEANKKWMDGALQERLSLFITDYGKKELLRLIKQRNEFYEGITG